jgi:hypothetical protein
MAHTPPRYDSVFYEGVAWLDGLERRTNVGEHYAVAPFTGINSAGDTFQHRCPCGEGLVSICSGLLAERERAGRVMERVERYLALDSTDEDSFWALVKDECWNFEGPGRCPLLTALERALDAAGAECEGASLARKGSK